MNKEDKIKILTKFFSDSLDKDDPHLDRILSLKDDWDDTYQENRIKKSFKQSEILANEFVISKVLSENYC